MSLRPPAGRAQRCCAQRQATSARRAKDAAPKHREVAVSLNSRPIITSASGSVVYSGQCQDVLQWVRLLDQHEIVFQEEFYRRFLLALLRPLFPLLADDLVRSFKDARSSHSISIRPHYPICLHLKHAQEAGPCCPATPSFGLASTSCIPSVTFSALLRRGVFTQISRFLSAHAAQDLGFARLARMCHLEQQGAAAGALPWGAGAFWDCLTCAFPNEDTESVACVACRCERPGPVSDPAVGLVERWLQATGELDLDVALTTEEAVKKMRKLKKKLNQVRRALDVLRESACLTRAQIKQLNELHVSGVDLQEDQIRKVRSENAVVCQLRHLGRRHPRAFFAMADRFTDFSPEDITEADLQRASQARAFFLRYTDTLPAAFGDQRWELEASFHLPLRHNVRRNAMMLFKCHNFDMESAQAAASLAALQPGILLAKHALVEPISRIMRSAQPKLARLLTNMLIKHLETEFLHRIAESPLPPDINFKIAFSELQRHQPRIAEMLKFVLHELNHVGRGAFDVDPYDLDDLSPALQDARVLEMAACGELVQLPKWLQGLPCTSAINEVSCVEVTCSAPTKVYMVHLTASCHPQTLLMPPHCVPSVDASAWKFETSAKLFVRYAGMQLHAFMPAGAKSRTAGDSPQFLKKSAPDECLVCSMTLSAGVYKLDTTDAIYFFDTHRHVKQQRLQAAGAAPCRFMQSDGVCSAGDCCEYSHVPPTYYSPEVPVYILCMLRQCQRFIQSTLYTRITHPSPSLQLARLYIKHKGHGYFAARRRVLPAALVAALVARLVWPNATKCQARAVAACRQLPQRIYSGLMARADDFDDEDPAGYVERGGYRFRTLFKHTHSRQAHVLGCGALFYVGGCMRSEHGYRALPQGWEVCPPDAVSVAVCSQHSWQSTSLALADGMKHATLACVCEYCLCCVAAGTARQPHTNGGAIMQRSDRGLEVNGADVLIRRRTCAHHHAAVPAAAVPAAAVPAAAAPAAAAPAPQSMAAGGESMAASDLAELLARCCLERASPLQQQHIREFLDKKKKTFDDLPDIELSSDDDE